MCVFRDPYGLINFESGRPLKFGSPCPVDGLSPILLYGMFNALSSKKASLSLLSVTTMENNTDPRLTANFETT